MRITVMTADEQIISLDVDPHETVKLERPLFACILVYNYLHFFMVSGISVIGWKRESFAWSGGKNLLISCVFALKC